MDQKELDGYRLGASLLLIYAVNDSVRSVQDPVFRLITEGRYSQIKGYSSCADLAHWMYFRLGVRQPWLNRKEYPVTDGGHGWRVALNLNLLVPPPIGTCPVANACRKLSELPEVGAGDVLVINNQYGGHVICVAGSEAQPDGTAHLTTAEYGQPGGAKKEHVLQFSKESGLCFLTGSHGANQVISHISLAKALELPGRVTPDLQMLDAAQKAVLKTPH